MRISTKQIALGVLLLLLVGYLCGTIVWSAHRINRTRCVQMEIVIIDSLERSYVSCAELENLLVRQGLYPVGQTLHDVCTQEIEDAITAHPMVRKAQCYTTPFGTVEVRLTQRVPIMRVVTEGESYFVDADRLQMPIRESVTTPVLLAVGAINPRMACHELADMALWIKHEAYWSERIASIHVTNPRYVYLVQKPDETKIILGDLTNYKGKLRKLHRLYTKGFEQIGWRTYKEIDLRYRGQVIGRKTED